MTAKAWLNQGEAITAPLEQGGKVLVRITVPGRARLEVPGEYRPDVVMLGGSGRMLPGLVIPIMPAIPGFTANQLEFLAEVITYRANESPEEFAGQLEGGQDGDSLPEWAYWRICKA